MSLFDDYVSYETRRQFFSRGKSAVRSRGCIKPAA